MLNWIKQHKTVLISLLAVIAIAAFLYGCEPKVKSLNSSKLLVTRAELQIELDTMISLAKARMARLDQQEAIRNLILQNALIVTQGQPFNPIGLLTGFAAIYGVGQAGTKVIKKVKSTKTT